MLLAGRVEANLSRDRYVPAEASSGVALPALVVTLLAMVASLMSAPTAIADADGAQPAESRPTVVTASATSAVVRNLVRDSYIKWSLEQPFFDSPSYIGALNPAREHGA